MRKKTTIFISLILLLIILLLIPQKKEYSKTYHYFDTDILIKITTKQKGNKILEEINSLYKKYSQLIDKYQEYHINLYKIRHNFNQEEYLTLEPELSKLIQYGIEEYKKTDGIIDISKGNIYDLWKTYIDTKIGIPTKEELELVNNQSIENIQIKDNKIRNNHVNIDINSIIIPYLNEIIKETLEKNKIKEYYIYTEDTILLGEKKKSYKIYLPNINQILKMKNKAVVTISNNESYEYNNQLYHKQINPKTLYPSNYMKSVTVICDNSNEANRYANILFHRKVEDGYQYIKSINNVEVIWVQNDNQIIKTDGISKYE